MIALHPYSLPLAMPYRWAKGEQHERVGFLARCERDGAVGWGESAPPIHLTLDPHALVAAARRLLEGLDDGDPGFLAALDARDPDPRLRCAIATAWLAARAAAVGMPLAGSSPARRGQSRRPCRPTAWVTDALPDDALRVPRRSSRRAIARSRSSAPPIGRGIERRVAAVREAAPAARLRLDAKRIVGAGMVARPSRRSAAFDIEYVEQPLPSDHGADAQAAYRRQSPIKVALDESATDLPAIAALLDAGAADVIILKPQRAGGPDRAKAIIDLCRARGVRVTVTVSLETAVGATAALHVASLLPAPLPDCGLAMGRFLARDVAAAPELEDGRMIVPTVPGLGIDAVDLDATLSAPPRR